MTRDLALLAFVVLIIILAVVISSEHRPNGYAVPLLVEAEAVRPVWTLTPRCSVNSRNLPRHIERIA